MPDTGMPTVFLLWFFHCFAQRTPHFLYHFRAISGKGLPNDFGTLHVKVHFYSFHKRVLLI